MCLAIQGPFAGLGPFWAIPGETLPRAALGLVVGFVNAVGNVGGFAGAYIVGWLKKDFGSIVIPFTALGAAMILAAALAFLLPRSQNHHDSVRT